MKGSIPSPSTTLMTTYRNRALILTSNSRNDHLQWDHLYPQKGAHGMPSEKNSGGYGKANRPGH